MGSVPVSVCITNYNGARYLTWCLDAVRRLDPSPAEILVVDNASTDESRALIRRDHPDVRLIELSENLGPSPARNRGLEEAANPLVFQIDCDIAPRPDALEILLEALETGGDEVAICQPRAVFADRPDRIHYDGGHFHYVGLMNLRRFYTPVPDRDETPDDVDAVISMALLLRRDMVLEAGGYDPAFFILFEDHDLSYRLRIAGRRLLAVPRSVVLHREGTEGVSFREGGYPKRRAFLHSRNRWIVLVKNHRLRTLLITLPGLGLFEAVWLVFSLREGFLLDYLKGKLSFFRLLPSLLAARRQLQARRRLPDRDLLGARDLTFSPLIKASGFEAFLMRNLNRLLRAWWRLARPLSG